MSEFMSTSIQATLCCLHEAQSVILQESNDCKSFDEINYTSENLTNWVYEDEIVKHATKDSKILDLGTAAGEKLLKHFPICSEILGTDFSKKKIICK